MQNNDENIEDLPNDVEADQDEVTFEEEGEISQDTIKKLRAKLKKVTDDRTEYLAGWQRAKADYINLRSATEKATNETIHRAKESVLHDLLYVLDSFELAMNNKQAWQEVSENWRRGVEHIYNQLKRTIEAHGLIEIKAADQPFNPAEHHSIETVDVESDQDDNIVQEVVRKGYRLGNKVIRPAQVKVGIYNK